ncbi:hypothetical protein MRX96_043346 [Rhipicephalus microplus]
MVNVDGHRRGARSLSRADRPGLRRLVGRRDRAERPTILGGLTPRPARATDSLLVAAPVVLRDAALFFLDSEIEAKASRSSTLFFAPAPPLCRMLFQEN